MTSAATDRQALDRLAIDTIRTLAMDAVQKANSGHPGTPMALAPIAYVLYTRVMRHNPQNANWWDRDRFVLSAGHASMLLYSMLYLTGYGLTLDDLKNFRQLGSPTAGHPEYGDAAGIETTTGPLGQGISNSVGLALAERMLAERFNKPGHQIVDHYTYTIASDGDMQEGVQAEAASFAGHLGLGRLIAFWDDNHISIEGDTALSFSEDVGKRYEAYGWHVQNLGEDLELDRIEEAVAVAKAAADQPSLIIVRTHIAAGSPNKQDTEAAHGSPLGVEEVKLTKEAYGWPSEEPFYVPQEALDHFRECLERGAELEREWQERYDAYKAEWGEEAAELGRIMNRELPKNWDADVPKFTPDDGMIATRKASQTVIQWVAEKVPELIGGSADLAPSTLTTIEGAESVSRTNYGGRNIHYGIREHGMGAIVNGLVLHGLRAFGSTFLIFSDYMKGAIRLSALMRIPSIWVFTHDSIGLGEDGPTHQPIEQLAHLRATPNLRVVRPAGANEAARAWQYAINRREGPTAMALSRQGLPVWDPKGVPADAIERGGYVLRGKGGRPDVILIGTGSEVHVCNAAVDLLDQQGVTARLVSMPCVENFLAQGEDYRNQVLPPDVKARVTVEAATTLGWERIAGDNGAIIGMTTFGESAPQKDVYAHFGFTAEHVAEVAKDCAERNAE
ncbi:MAG TPA: transketolase [Thermoleophilaceae bacterium]|jgi:transketolase|nr:transketolase [Thermoleophilaceae bacterium]